MIYVEDAETGEQIFVDTNDAGFRQRLRGARPTSGRRRCARSPHGRDDLLHRRHRRRPRARPGPHRRPAPGGERDDDVRVAMDAAVPRVPSRRWCWLPAAAARAARPARRAGRLGLVAPARRAGRRRRTCRRRCCSPPWRCCSSRWRGPRRPCRAAPGGHGDPRVRRVRQHGRHRPHPDPAGRRQGRGARRSSSGSRRPCGSASSPSAAAGSITQQPTDDQARACSPRSTGSTPHGGTALGRGHADRRSAPSRASRCWSTRRAGPVEPQRPDLGYHGSAAVVLLSDGENTAGPDPLDVAELASSAGVRVYPVGLGSRRAARCCEVDGFQVATALDEPMLRKIADAHRRPLLRRPPTRRRWPRSTDAIDLEWTVETEHIEITGLLAAAAGAAAARRRRALAALVRAGGLMTLHLALALLALLAVPAARRRATCGSCAAAPAGGAVLERRADPGGGSAARRLAAARPVRAAAGRPGRLGLAAARPAAQRRTCPSRVGA